MDRKIYTKKEALVLMLSGETMRIALNKDFYYYLDGKFYRSGDGEWDTNDIIPTLDWIK